MPLVWGRLKLKKTSGVLIIVVFILLLGTFETGLTFPGTNKIYLPPELKELVQENRPGVFLEREEAEREFATFLYPLKDREELKPEAISIAGERARSITREEALADIEFLFRVLPGGYAGYELMGSDEVFAISQKALKKEIKTFSRDRIWVSELKELLLDQLSFIVDGHFRIEGQPVFSSPATFLSEDIQFFKGEEGFYLQEEGARYYLQAIENRPPEEYLRLSINEAGQLYYRLSKRGQAGEKQELTLFLEKEGGLSSKKVVLQPAYPGEYQEKFFESSTVKDIPVVTNRSFFSEGEQELDDFLESASRLREAPVGILDLRGHRGGSDYLAGEWIANYTEQSPALAACYSDLRTSTACKLMENRFRGDRNMLEQVRQRFAPREEGWSEMVYVPPEELESEGVLLVLVDNQVASAGESLIRLLRQVENVIFMGINTAGITHFGNVGLLHLPHSGLQVEMGVTLFFEPDLVFREGQGFEPDIWVDPTRALELGLIFLEKLIP